MSYWQKYNNKILKVNSKIAIHPRCCCGYERCCCTRLYEMIPPPDMIATIIAPGCPIDGAVSPMPLVGSPFSCLRWATDGFDKDCTPPVSIGFEMFCIDVNDDNNCFRYRVNGGANASGCANGSLRSNVFPTACSCGTECPGNPFYALFTGFSATDRFPGAGCNCCSNFSVRIDEVC